MGADRGPLLVTGFGAFLSVRANPSGALAEALAVEPPDGLEVVARVLPVSFAGAERALDLALGALLPRRPAAHLALGVQREAWFRLEARARALIDSRKPDAEGGYAVDLGSLGPCDLATGLELEPIVAAMRAAGAVEARASFEAGGYVCERTYYAALERGARGGFPAVFLHVPPAERVPLAAQLPVVRAALLELARQSGA